MQSEPYRLLLKSVAEANILPVTSACNSRCLFCSHRQNPPGIRVYTLPRLGADEILELAEFLDPGHKIVIGESVTRISEGEPFLHSDFLSILTGLRHRFPATTIQITTNGLALTPSTINDLARLERVELVLSLNSATARGRQKLMGDDNPAAVLRAVSALGEKGMVFHGSIVALPHLVGWDDLWETIGFLSGSGAATIRIFMPGYTRYTKGEWVPPPGVEGELRELVAAAGRESRVPLVLEPPGVTDLTPRILGIIKDSPAHGAGLQAGDIITAVDGKPPFSRVDAFQRIKAAGRAVIDYRRQHDDLQVELHKEVGAAPGVVMAFDLDPGIYRRFINLLRRRVTTRSLVATSPLAAPMLESALAGTGEALPPVEIVPVPNRSFGGNICCGGLLLLEDLAAALAPAVAVDPPQGIFVPGIAFADQGRDLRGRSYLELEKILGIPVELIS